jgi:Icc-related predicted phosphoesterase
MHRILAIADVHGKAENLKKIVQDNEPIEAVLFAGDITNFGGKDEASRVIDSVLSDGHARTVLAVAGNCDTKSVQDYIESAGIGIEGRFVDLGYATVIGAGGGLFRNGFTSFERTEDELYQALHLPLMQNLGFARENPSPMIVLTHTPPYGCCADLRYGRHVGSKSLAALLTEYDIEAWVCGHIHESKCIAREGRCTVCNPGPSYQGNAILLEIEGNRISMVDLSKSYSAI